MQENNPLLWQAHLPRPRATDNKYNRGHLLVMGAASHQTGASRMAAMAGLRIGAGAVTVGSSSESLNIYAAHLTAVMIAELKTLRDFDKLVEERHISGFVIGPGAGVNDRTYEFTLAMVETGLPVVIDADSITVFSNKYQGRAAELFAAIKNKNSKVVMTPHAGEFKRLFAEITPLDAAKLSGAVVLLKGNKTVITKPTGESIINHNAPPTLATAGSGDVLSGIIGGLMSQNMEPFLAASAGAWIHGEAANIFGPGLIAEDLPGLIPEVLKQLL